MAPWARRLTGSISKSMTALRCSPERPSLIAPARNLDQIRIVAYRLKRNAAVLTNDVRARREEVLLDHFRDEVAQDDEVAQEWDAVHSTFPHQRYEIRCAREPKDVIPDTPARVAVSAP